MSESERPANVCEHGSLKRKCEICELFECELQLAAKDETIRKLWECVTGLLESYDVIQSEVDLPNTLKEIVRGAFIGEIGRARRLVGSTNERNED